MPDMAFRFRRNLKYVHRRFREWRMLWKGIASTDHPVLAHIIPMRRCNLACAYCNEYDDVSKPVPLETMIGRLDRLAALGTTVVSISGGEPLMHPELDEIVAHIRKRRMMAGMITNGYLLTAARIERLNRAGLEHMQISIDNVMPDDVSKKSLKVLDKKLQLLAEHAEFHVNINSVVGGGIRNPQDALTVGRRAIELGLHLDGGDHPRWRRSASTALRRGVRRLSGNQEAGPRQLRSISILSRTTSRTEKKTSGDAAPAPAISTSARTAWCITARSSAATPASRSRDYTVEDIRREFVTEKSCAPRCTVACVHYTSYMDFWRAPQTIPARAPAADLVQIK